MSLDKAFEKIISEREAALLKPVASQLGVALKEYGYLEIYSFPSLDSILAASIALGVLVRNGIDFTLIIDASTPRELREPSLLLGYPTQIATETRAQRPSALIGVGEKPPGLLHLVVTSADDSSIAALTAAVFSELTVVGYPSIYSLVAGYWRRLDKGKKAAFTGLEASIAEMLKLENKVEEIFSLRLFRWPELGTEEAMARTLDPYLPGLTGKLEECIGFLRGDPRLAKLLGKKQEEAPEQSIAVLGERLYELVKKASRRPRRPTDVIGITYYSYVFPLHDLREAVYVIAYYAAMGYAGQVAAVAIDEKAVSAAALYNYTKDFDTIIGLAESLLENEERMSSYSLGRARVKTIEAGGGAPLPVLSRILGQLGYIGEQELLGVETSQGLLVLVEDALDALGSGQFYELLARGCIEYLEGSMFARIVKEKCW